MEIGVSSIVNNKSILRRNGSQAERIRLHEDTSVKLVIVVADYKGIMIGSFYSALPRSVDPSSVC